MILLYLKKKETVSGYNKGGCRRVIFKEGSNTVENELMVPYHFEIQS